LQEELSETYPLLQIQLLGVNERGQEPGNTAVAAGRDLPWLQDVDGNGNGSSDVWRDLWNVAFDDIVILDGDNAKVGVYNVNFHDLDEPENYATLRDMLVDAAMESQKPWMNPNEPLDVDNDGYVIPRDVLIVINRLNSLGSGRLPPPVTNESPPPYYDCNGDGDITPLDALQQINFLNARPAQGGGEGESSGLPEPLVGATARSTDLAQVWLAVINRPSEIDGFSTAASPAQLDDTLALDADARFDLIDRVFSEETDERTSTEVRDRKASAAADVWEQDDPYLPLQAAAEMLPDWLFPTA
jgi:hypothetical protein